MYIPVFRLILDASVPAESPAGDIAVVVYGWLVDDVVGDGRGSSKKLQYNKVASRCHPLSTYAIFLGFETPPQLQY